MSDAFEPFVESSGLLGDSERVRERMDADGYLYLPALLPSEAVEGLRLDVLRILNEHELLDPSAPVEEGVYGRDEPADRSVLEAFHKQINRLDSFERLAHEPSLLGAMSDLLGPDVHVHARKICRVKYPSDPFDVVLPHQDHWYIKGDPLTYSVWIPLMPMDESVGGLAIAPGSHRDGFLEHGASEDSRFTGVTNDAMPTEWRWSPFQQGDALIFHSMTVHQGLLNRSQRIRLSVDYRYQRVGTPMEASHNRPHFGS